MDSHLARSSTVLCNFLCALFVTAALNYLTGSFMVPSEMPGSISKCETYDMQVNQYLKSDQSNIGFDMEFDFRRMFNWNTKLIFVTVVASYKSTRVSNNEVTLWDMIIQSPENAVMKPQRFVNKYPLRDNGRGLRNREVTVELWVHRHPVIGVASKTKVKSTKFRTPSKYFSYEGPDPASKRAPSDGLEEILEE